MIAVLDINPKEKSDSAKSQAKGHSVTIFPALKAARRALPPDLSPERQLRTEPVDPAWRLPQISSFWFGCLEGSLPQVFM